MPFLTVSFIKPNNLFHKYNHVYNSIIKYFIITMLKKLALLERRISSLEGATLKIVVQPTSGIVSEVHKSFVSMYGTADIDSLAKL